MELSVYIETLSSDLKEIVLDYIVDVKWKLNRSYSRSVRCIIRRVRVFNKKLYKILNTKCMYTTEMDTRMIYMHKVPYIMNTVECMLIKLLKMLVVCAKLQLTKTLCKAVFICNQSRIVCVYLHHQMNMNEAEMKRVTAVHEQLHDTLMSMNQQRYLSEKFSIGM